MTSDVISHTRTRVKRPDPAHVELSTEWLSWTSPRRAGNRRAHADTIRWIVATWSGVPVTEDAVLAAADRRGIPVRRGRLCVSLQRWELHDLVEHDGRPCAARCLPPPLDRPSVTQLVTDLGLPDRRSLVGLLYGPRPRDEAQRAAALGWLQRHGWWLIHAERLCPPGRMSRSYSVRSCWRRALRAQLARMGGWS